MASNVDTPGSGEATETVAPNGGPNAPSNAIGGASEKGQTSQVADRLSSFGQTIFTEISALAAKHKAVNLGQGFPNYDGADFVKEAAIQAIRDGKSQYALMGGVPELVDAIADNFEKDTGLRVDPKTEVTVTAGCTEAIAAAFLGLCNPGDEVVVFEPAYDSYKAAMAMAGAVVRPVVLRPPDFSFSWDDLRAAFSHKTRAILINTPHNPTGRVFTTECCNRAEPLTGIRFRASILRLFKAGVVEPLPGSPIRRLSGPLSRLICRRFNIKCWSPFAATLKGDIPNKRALRSVVEYV